MKSFYQFTLLFLILAILIIALSRSFVNDTNDYLQLTKTELTGVEFIKNVQLLTIEFERFYSLHYLIDMPHTPEQQKHISLDFKQTTENLNNTLKTISALEKKYPQYATKEFNDSLKTINANINNFKEIKQIDKALDQLRAISYDLGDKAMLNYENEKELYIMASIMTHYMPELTGETSVNRRLILEYFQTNNISIEKNNKIISSMNLVILSREEIEQMINLISDNYDTGELKPLLKEINIQIPVLQQVVNALFEKESVSVDAVTFFHIADEIIINIIELHTENIRLLENGLNNRVEKLIIKINRTNALILTIVIIIIIGWILLFFTTRSAFKREEESKSLLTQYQNTIDLAMLVSKTDAKGIITYANDKFCQISGYTEEELIGKPHNIIKHPDMESIEFKNMWKILKNKEPWTGKIKNRKKNGDIYYVNSVINPILDNDGNILEYIAIRTDITTLETIKEELENNLDISNENFSEVYKKSQQYQHAIEKSTILSRIDTDGKITFANEQFCEISGYTKDELIGQEYTIVQSEDNEVYTQLWDTICSGNTWKGQLHNLKKSGEHYYVDAVFMPLFDKNDKIIEYLAIRHDITDTINMHVEMEDTQKEIIFKMGEVGESRSKETGNHVKRVAHYSKLLAKLAGLSREDEDLLFSASPMHDIGKVGIPDSILKKPGALDSDEWTIMKTHAEIGYKVLKDSKRPILKSAAIVAYTHHEKWNGSGYPNAISGEEIHIFGRITAIVDVFDALGSDRCYKKAWELEKILQFFKEERGKHFDPNLIDLFLENIDNFLVIRDKFSDTTT